MAGKSLPDPADADPVTERTECLELPGPERTAADHGLAEVEMRRPGGEGGVASSTPVALPIEDSLNGLIR